MFRRNIQSPESKRKSRSKQSKACFLPYPSVLNVVVVRFSKTSLKFYKTPRIHPRREVNRENQKFWILLVLVLEMRVMRLATLMSGQVLASLLGDIGVDFHPHGRMSLLWGLRGILQFFLNNSEKCLEWELHPFDILLTILNGGSTIACHLALNILSS
jgi:hypothetical protein